MEVAVSQAAPDAAPAHESPHPPAVTNSHTHRNHRVNKRPRVVDRQAALEALGIDKTTIAQTKPGPKGSVQQPSPSTRSADLAALSEAAGFTAANADVREAIAACERTLATDPPYLPARLELADVLWNEADGALAAALYRTVVASYPNDLIPPRARERGQPR